MLAEWVAYAYGATVHEEGLEPERTESTQWTQSVEDHDLAKRGAPKAQ